jgi:hypothetical protein
MRGHCCSPRPCYATSPACLPLHHTSRRPSSPLPCAYTAVECSPRPHSRCHLTARGRTHLIVAVASTAGTARLGHHTRPIARGSATAHRGPHSRPPAAIPLLHCDRTGRSRCAVLRPPACQVLLKAHTASVYFKCFRGMLQVFQTDIAKADRDVAYVAMVVYLCYKGLLPMFHLCFGDICCKCVYLDVAFVSHICCRHFICMLRMFAMIFKCFQKLFLVFQKHVSSVSSVFFFLRVNGGERLPT